MWRSVTCLLASAAWLITGCELVASITERRFEASRRCEEGQWRCHASGVQRCLDASWVDDRSHVGCDFAAVTLPSYRRVEGQGVATTFALLVTNPGMEEATLDIGGTEATVPSGGVRQIVVPFTGAVADPGPTSVLVPSGAVSITSDQPVSVVQLQGANPAVNDSDASLLIPWHVAPTSAVFAATPHVLSTIEDMRSHAVVVAREPTKLAVEGNGNTAVHPLPGLSEMGTGSVSLGGGDVMVLQTRRTSEPEGSMCGWNSNQLYYGCGTQGSSPDSAQILECPDVMPPQGSPCSPDDPTFGFVGCCANGGAIAVWCPGAQPPSCPRTPQGLCHELCPFHQYDPIADLSGLRLSASAPILAFAGHACALAPLNTKYCSHLETSLTPPPKGDVAQVVVGPDSSSDWELRIVATEPATQVVTDPPLPGGVSPDLASAGQVLSFTASEAAYAVTATKPVAVTAIRLGSDNVTPPAMVAAAIPSRGLTRQIFATAAHFTEVVLTVVGPTGTLASVGSTQAPLSEAIGSGGLALHRFTLTGATDATRFELTSDQPVVAFVHAAAPLEAGAGGRKAAYWHRVGNSYASP